MAHVLKELFSTLSVKSTYLGENVVNENEYLSAMVGIGVGGFAGAKWWRKVRATCAGDGTVVMLVDGNNKDN